MEYSRLVQTYEELGETQSTLEKTDILAELFEESDDQLEEIVLLAMGRAFPYWKDLDLGISSKTMVKIIKESSGATEDEIEQEWKDAGDLGSAAEKIMEKGGGQQSLMQKKLTVERVVEKLDKVAKMDEKSLGSVSQDKKRKEVAALLNDATPKEARYIVRTFIENLRLGVGEGTVRDALAETFFDGEHAEEIQKAYNFTNDFSQVAAACREGIKEVRSLEMELFRPVSSMLAKKVDTIQEGFETVEKPAAIDYKYDGMRAQIHVKGEEVKIYTRRLDDVTEQFPDVEEAVKEHIESDACIIDTEILAYDPEDGSTIPFQKLSKRIKRKYDIEKMVEEIPVEVLPFDLLYEQETMIEEEYQDRWQRLNELVNEEEQELQLVDHDETDSVERVGELQQKSLEEGHEGIMMKNLEAEYKPGNRVGYMVKLKPTMENLDLAIVGAKWSEGERAGWLGRLFLGCYDEEAGEYKEVGKMATGLTEEQFQEMTDKLEPLITNEEGRKVDVKTEVIVEVEYEEIQESPNYSSGYALRFPRMKAFREDKEEADSLEKVKKLYKDQN